MSNTANLGLPVIEAAQAQKHVTHNEALRLIDTLVQLAVADRDLTAPPGSPAEGERWIVGPSPSGDWAGHADDIAAWQDGAWQFSTPQTGWLAFVADENKLLVWSGAAWDDVFAAITTLQNLALLGVGTTADATNPFSAKLNKALWTAKTAAEGGDGDLRYTLNKEAASDVVSLLLQTGFSGRAELGLIGDDNLTLKVSADGSAWATALVADRTTGAVTLPNTPAATRGLLLPQTRALIAAMTAEPRRARTFLIDNLIAALIDAGVWAKLDQFYLLAAADSQAARLNWVNPAAAATAVNSPTFTANRGYAGDGATSYLVGAAIDGANFAQDSAAIFAWSLTDAATTTGIVGNDGFLNASIRPRTISNNLDSRLNNTTTSSVAVVDSLGLFVLSRGASANYDRYRNAASLGAAAVASTAAAAGNLIALRDFNSYSTRQIAAFGSGGYLAAAEVTALYNALYAYLHDSTVGAV